MVNYVSLELSNHFHFKNIKILLRLVKLHQFANYSLHVTSLVIITGPPSQFGVIPPPPLMPPRPVNAQNNKITNLILNNFLRISCRLCQLISHHYHRQAECLCPHGKISRRRQVFVKFDTDNTARHFNILMQPLPFAGAFPRQSFPAPPMPPRPPAPAFAEGFPPPPF